jgi:tetrahydromethanopterin S-methyltransferase subunit G
MLPDFVRRPAFRAAADHFRPWRIDSRLDGVDSRVDGIDTRVDKIDTRVDRIDNRIDGVDTRVDQVDSVIDFVDSRIDPVDSRIDFLHPRAGLGVILSDHHAGLRFEREKRVARTFFQVLDLTSFSAQPAPLARLREARSDHA